MLSTDFVQVRGIKVLVSDDLGCAGETSSVSRLAAGLFHLTKANTDTCLVLSSDYWCIKPHLFCSGWQRFSRVAKQGCSLVLLLPNPFNVSHIFISGLNLKTYS